jgi:hypothetical protein
MKTALGAGISFLGFYRMFISGLSIRNKARRRPGPYARQDGGGILTAPMSIRARSSCSVLDALRALPPVLGLEAALAHRWSVLATRNPLLLFRFVVLFLLRLAERRFCGLLFQEPPRRTRTKRGHCRDDGHRHESVQA